MNEYEKHIRPGNLKPEPMPSEYEALRTEIERMGTSYVAYAAAVDRYAAVVNEQVAALWADNAELRDELHAVANRLEALTRGLATEPIEVAETMLTRTRWRECSECGSDIRRGMDGLIYDAEGLHTCRESVRRIVAGAE